MTVERATGKETGRVDENFRTNCFFLHSDV